jgi:hypothetical protein
MPAEDKREAMPWERPGQARRDALPHRGLRLDVLGTVSVLCGIVAFGLFIPGLFGLPLGVTALAMARRDLRDMRFGLVDPRGKAQTEEAKRWAFWGVALNLAALMLAGLLLMWLAASGVLGGRGWS